MTTPRIEEIRPVLNDWQKWKGLYKGINFEICKWKPDYYRDKPEYDKGYIWNYYIFVKPRELQTVKYKDFPERIDYNAMYPDIDMHGGITYFSRHKTSGLHEVDELGCDYQHSWDEGIEYILEDLIQDAKNTIDKLPEDLFFNN